MILSINTMVKKNKMETRQYAINGRLVVLYSLSLSLCKNHAIQRIAESE